MLLGGPKHKVPHWPCGAHPSIFPAKDNRMGATLGATDDKPVEY